MRFNKNKTLSIAAIAAIGAGIAAPGAANGAASPVGANEHNPQGGSVNVSAAALNAPKAGVNKVKYDLQLSPGVSSNRGQSSTSFIVRVPKTLKNPKFTLNNFYDANGNRSGKNITLPATSYQGLYSDVYHNIMNTMAARETGGVFLAKDLETLYDTKDYAYYQVNYTAPSAETPTMRLSGAPFLRTA